MTHRSLAACALLALAGAARAELVCDRPDHDAGQVRGGTTIVHRFALSNHGRERIEFGEPKAACGCLRPSLDRRALSGAETASVAVEINTVTQTAGDNLWRITVPYRENGREGELLLQVRARVIPELSITPAALVLHTDAEISHGVTLTERRGEPVTVHAATTTSEHVKVRVSESVKQDGVWHRMIALQVMPDCPEGRHEHVLHLHTNDPAYPELKVPFTVVKHPAGMVRPSPETAEWRGSREEPLPSRIVLLTGGDDRPVVVERVETSHPCLRCTFASGPGIRATLRVVCEGPPAGGFEGEVRVHISKPVPQTVTVPVRVLVP